MTLKETPSVEAYFSRYGNTVYRLAYAITCSQSDAEDVCQNVFVKLSASLDKKRFASDEHVEHWLMRVAINEAKDILRDRRRHRFVDPCSMGEISQDEPGFETFEAEGTTRDLRHQVRAILARLKPDYKVVLYLRYYAGYRCEDIARLLHKNPSTVRTQLKRALECVCQKLQEAGYEAIE